jgi:hypothetical protein
MTQLLCVPVTVSIPLSDVAVASVTEAERTFGKDAIFSQTVQVAGHSAFGDLAEIDNSPAYSMLPLVGMAMSVSEEFTDLWNNYYLIGVNSDIILNPDNQGIFAYCYAGSFYIQTADTNAGDFTDIDIVGLFGGSSHWGSGPAGRLIGLQYSSGNYGGGAMATVGIEVAAGNFGAVGSTVALAQGININAIAKSANRNITAAIGLDIANQTAATTNFAIRTRAGDVVFNEDSNNNMKFRVEGANDANLLVTDGPNDAVAIGAATRADSAKLYVAGKISTSDEMEINGALNHDGSTIGLNGNTPVAKGTITGSRGGNAALASLLTFLASRGDITDSTSA